MIQENSFTIVIGKPCSGKSTAIGNLFPKALVIKSDSQALTDQSIPDPDEFTFDDADGLALDEVGQLGQESYRAIEHLARVLRKRGKTLTLVTQDRTMPKHLSMAHVIDMDRTLETSKKGAE